MILSHNSMPLWWTNFTKVCVFHVLDSRLASPWLSPRPQIHHSQTNTSLFPSTPPCLSPGLIDHSWSWIQNWDNIPYRVLWDLPLSVSPQVLSPLLLSPATSFSCPLLLPPPSTFALYWMALHLSVYLPPGIPSSLVCSAVSLGPSMEEVLKKYKTNLWTIYLCGSHSFSAHFVVSLVFSGPSALPCEDKWVNHLVWCCLRDFDIPVTKCLRDRAREERFLLVHGLSCSPPGQGRQDPVPPSMEPEPEAVYIMAYRKQRECGLLPPIRPHILKVPQALQPGKFSKQEQVGDTQVQTQTVFLPRGPGFRPLTPPAPPTRRHTHSPKPPTPFSGWTTAFRGDLFFRSTRRAPQSPLGSTSSICPFLSQLHLTAARSSTPATSRHALDTVIYRG